MQSSGRRPRARRLALWLALGAVAATANAQPSRIWERIDNTRRAVLTGHIHPQARPENDQGRVSPSLVLPYVTLALAPSDAQAAELEQLLADQQNPASPDYHRWLTPEQYAQRFGVSEADMSRISGWLQSQGLIVVSIARARNWIAVGGTAAQVENAFQMQLHQYLVNGETHFANASEPSVPAALAGVIKSIQGLTDFRLKPAVRRIENQPAGARYTSGKTGNHYIAPDDLATIYDITPVYAAGIDGTGQKLVIAGQVSIDLSDIRQFRSNYGLPANDPQTVLVPNAGTPGTDSNDLAESDLDLEWSGAVARNATIVFVYSYNVMDAVQYAIDQNLAPMISTSYGLCEPEMRSGAGNAFTLRTWAQQANSQGITWFAASGDSGGADCDDSQNTGLAVDVPASIPEVTGVGGTEFNEGGGKYWNTTNSANLASALSYIPEVVWNDSAIDGTPSASGGGSSGYFPRPSWQTGPGVPNDNFRHVPDVALSASADHDGYFVYTGGSLSVYGGTSVPTPSFAGIAALINQYMVFSGAQSSPGLGNINPKLYTLAQTTSGVFHDVVTGNNIVTVSCGRSRGCSSSPVGYSAGPGYDQATGLGSVDAYKLVAAWAGASSITGPRSTAPPAIGALTNAASYQQVYAPGMILTVFGTELAPSSQAAGSVPLPSGMAGVSATIDNIPAPFYYASSGQLNLQIPYEAGLGAATLVVNNNGQTVSQPFTIASLAPGIFTDQNGVVVPFGSAAPGDVITLYITGAGLVTPPVATGAVPDASTPLANLPAPVQSVTVTVGDLPAGVTFVGIPWGLVGAVQVNYQVPNGVGPGPQPVVVSVGGVPSAAATLNITN